MEQEEDPYGAIKAEIDRELQQATTLQARLFGGHADVSGQLRSSLADTEEQLAALEAAVRRMVAEPATFGLTPAAAFGRQVEVETLRYTLADLQRTCAQAQTSSSGRGAGQAAPPAPAASQRGSAVELSALKLPAPGSSASSQWHIRADGTSSHLASSNGTSSAAGGGKPSGNSMPRPPAGPPIRHSKLVQSHRGAPAASSSGGGKQPAPQRPAAAAAGLAGDDDTRGLGDSDNGGAISYEAIMQQQMRQQDEALDHISVHVDRIKETGRLMHEELEEQAGLLSGVQEDVDTTHLRLRGLRRKVADVIRQSRQDRQLCLIIALSVVLVILTVLAIA